MDNQTSTTETARTLTPNLLDAGTLDVQQIMSILPHRYPFLLVDKVIEITRLKRLVAIKNVSINEPFFQGHFPGYPIMPGALIVEAIAQAGGLLLMPEVPDRDSLLMVFTGIDRAKFRRPVTPGDQLRVEVDVLNWKPRATRLHGHAYVEGGLACEAIVSCVLVPRAQKLAIESSPVLETVTGE
ncbi:MAG TPA: 3-hydroxyacyl-ACP dehydratase FabZ [Acidobacteriaceae bacterium]|jgi:3-hydroxyacyl-[acyl-carrier-protein] dehydratase|nr:3-hydroxyacyl-ACP dehydratase FabZ [Acidobacteriaceae bacterium]